jgi:hypothetical protein
MQNVKFTLTSDDGTAVPEPESIHKVTRTETSCIVKYSD